MNAQNKTTANNNSVDAFIAGLKDPEQQGDARDLVDMMRDVSGEPPKMWGTSIIGFGSRHYKYESGREGDIMDIGFSPRKGKLSLYVTDDASNYVDLLEKVGKYKIGKGCIYFTSLKDLDRQALRRVIKAAYHGVDQRIG